MNLKENIVEHFDFEAVSPNVWRFLYSWYSADWCIMRFVKRDKVNSFGVVLDLYPETMIPGQILEMMDQTDEESFIGDSGVQNRLKTVEQHDDAMQYKDIKKLVGAKQYQTTLEPRVSNY